MISIHPGHPIDFNECIRDLPDHSLIMQFLFPSLIIIHINLFFLLKSYEYLSLITKWCSDFLFLFQLIQLLNLVSFVSILHVIGFWYLGIVFLRGQIILFILLNHFGGRLFNPTCRFSLFHILCYSPVSY